MYVYINITEMEFLSFDTTWMHLASITLSGKDKDNYCMIALILESKKHKQTQRHTLVGARCGEWCWGKWIKGTKRHKLLIKKWDVMCSMVTTDNNTVLHI